MRVIEGVEGNVNSDPDLAAARDRHRDRGTLERLRIDDTQRRRSRFRATTDAGRELGVVVPGSDPLAPGDVLLDADAMVVVELTRVRTLAVRFPPDTEPTTAARVGHAAGNRHWDLAVESGAVHVPAGPDPDARRRTLEDVVPDEATVERGELSPAAFDGAPGQEDHTHGEDDSDESDHNDESTYRQHDNDEPDHHEHDRDESNHHEHDYHEHGHDEPDHHEHARDGEGSGEVSNDA